MGPVLIALTLVATAALAVPLATTVERRSGLIAGAATIGAVIGVPIAAFVLVQAFIAR